MPAATVEPPAPYTAREEKDNFYLNPSDDVVDLGEKRKDGGGDSASIAGEEVYQFDESRKLGVTSSVFLILNKMIGTGSMWLPNYRINLFIHSIT